MARTIVIVAECYDESSDRESAEQAMLDACAQFDDIASIDIALTAPGRFDLLTFGMDDFMRQAALEGMPKRRPT